ncbi:hypothetical protein [Sphingobacterium sp.]|uniref:hypothetical protein n=1 Tax=Sphingobacterium sp. TaxID=341027 RepID=UPI00289C85A8|nr:hypothetical protein [Sphingobacterium sp.]
MNIKTINRKIALIPLLFGLAGIIFFSSCSKNDDDVGGDTLIKRYGLTGKYRFQVTPTMMELFPVTTGSIDGTVTDEGNGVLRLRFSKFRANPMPFDMTVDAQFTVAETAKGLKIHNVEGTGYFDADPPAGGTKPGENPGFEIPEEALQQGLHSNGKAKITGLFEKNPDGSGSMQYDLKLDPGVALPVVVMIKSIQKLN